MVSYPSDDILTGGFQRATKSLEKSMEIGSIPELGYASNLPLFLERNSRMSSCK